MESGPVVFVCGMLAGGGLVSTAFLCLKGLRAWMLNDFEQKMEAIREEHWTKFKYHLADLRRDHDAKLELIRRGHESETLDRLRDRARGIVERAASRVRRD